MINLSQINPKTNLKETVHDYYKVPLVHQKNINVLRLGGQKVAVHNVPIGGGITLDFYSRFSNSTELFVVFHGANSDNNNFYPRFERVRSIKEKAPSFLSIADPTMQILDIPEMKLAWYLGGPDFDPMHSIAKVIRRAMGRTGAKYVAFIGGSGGGFAALRASSMWPNSLAFVQDPQTNVANYYPQTLRKYFGNLWQGWDRDALMRAFPERFDMVRYYGSFQPKNFVYYAQNETDTFHIENHYIPFAKVHGMETSLGANSNNSRYFALYKGERDGHGKITRVEFNSHFDSAVKFWRDNRLV